MKTEPTYRTSTTTINHGDEIDLVFKGENWGEGWRDTRVDIQRIGTICVIAWDDKEDFTRELKEVIDKYAI